jgi:hypothetical protein
MLKVCKIDLHLNGKDDPLEYKYMHLWYFGIFLDFFEFMDYWMSVWVCS